MHQVYSIDTSDSEGKVEFEAAPGTEITLEAEGDGVPK